MPNPTGPAAREAHDLPLAHRIVDKLIGDYINTHSDLAAAGVGNLNDYERGMAAGIDQMRNLHLAGWDYALVPKILDELTRAGLLRQEPADA